MRDYGDRLVSTVIHFAIGAATAAVSLAAWLIAMQWWAYYGWRGVAYMVGVGFIVASLGWRSGDV